MVVAGYDDLNTLLSGTQFAYKAMLEMQNHWEDGPNLVVVLMGGVFRCIYFPIRVQAKRVGKLIGITRNRNAVWWKLELILLWFDSNGSYY
jgi:hypothetical protein